MPAIASLEDLKAAQKDLLAAKDSGELKAAQGITICDSIPQSEFRIPHLEGSGTVERRGWMRLSQISRPDTHTLGKINDIADCDVKHKV
jgi:hypothetical protein